MNKYCIFFHTFDDIKDNGLGKCIADFQTTYVFNVGETIKDRSLNEFVITEIKHMIEWADDDAEHCIYVHCKSKYLMQHDAESLEDWS